jgi:EmrB/QacA subfamily drug resistance transporter
MPKLTENNRKWWILAGMSASLSLVFIDQTAISVALPAMARDLNANNLILQWLINAYLVSLAAIIIFGGKLGDCFGHRRIFFIGIILFILASLSSAVAGTAWWVIISRVMQGIGGAFMIPATSVIVAKAFPDNERGRAIGIYVAIASIFLSLGPVLSGALVYYLSWRWIFWINLPISMVSMSLAFYAVPKDKIKLNPKRLDWPGFITSAIAISSLVSALMEGVSIGWTSPIILTLFSIALIFATLFILVEMKAEDPIIHLSLFRKRAFLSANLCLLFVQSAFTVIIFWALLLQNAMGYSVFETGFFYLPVTLPILFMAPFGGYLRDRFGPRLPGLIGTTLMAMGLFWVGIFASSKHYLALFPGFLLFGIGPPLVYASIMATSMMSASSEHRGMAMGITSGVRQLGSSIGVALIGSLLISIELHQIINYLTATTGHLAQLNPHQLMGLLSGTDSAKAALINLSSIEVNQVYYAVKSAFLVAFSWGMMAACVLVGFAFIASWYLPNAPLVPKEVK